MTYDITKHTTVNAKWTLLIYMNGKNNLQDMMCQNWNEIAQTGSTPEVNIVVQMGRKTVSDGPDRPAYWQGVKRFLVKKGMTFSAENQLLDLQDAGLSTDMGDVSCLTDFLRWGKQHFPAERTMVVIWDHGQGWRIYSSSFDDVTGHFLYNTDVRNAIKETFGRIDVLCFDPCLMAMLETAYELREQVNYMVASENVVPGKGLSYKFLQHLNEKPDCDGLSLSRFITDSYAEKYAYNDTTPEDEKELITLSILDLKFTGDAVKSLNHLTNLIQNDPKTWELVKKTRHYFTTFDNNLSTSLDVISWIDKTRQECPSEDPLHSALSDAQNALSRIVYHNYTNNINPDWIVDGRKYNIDARGLAIFFPDNIEQQNTSENARSGYYPSNAEHPVSFVKDSNWPQFLHKIWGIDLQDTWTVLIYMNGQNDREPYLEECWREISQVGSSDRINIVVQMGRSKHSGTNQPWAGVKRFLVKKGMNADSNQQLEDLSNSGVGAVMDSYRNLANFVRWGKQKYPAGKTMLIVWGDCEYQNDVISESNNEKINFINVHKALKNTALNVIGFDSSLKARIETAYEIKSCTHWLVASESLMPASGLNYQFLSRLKENPSLTESEIGRIIVDLFSEKQNNTVQPEVVKEDGFLSLSLLNTSPLNGRFFSNKFNQLIEIIISNENNISLARQARMKLRSYCQDTSGIIDLWSWLNLMKMECHESHPLHAPVNTLMDIIHSVSTYTCSHPVNPANTPEDRSDCGTSRGISVYLPVHFDQINSLRDGKTMETRIDDVNLELTAFSKDVRWSKLLHYVFI